MDDSIFALAIPPLLLIPAMALLTRIRSSREIGAEFKRKALHVGTGLIALSFPLYFTTPWLICAGLGVVLVWMMAVRKLPSLRQRFGGCLHNTDRESYGEIYFALALAALLMLNIGQPLLYVVPLLVLTLADAAAAIAGRLAPVGHLRGIAAGKTVTGSVTFLLIAFLVTSLALHAFTGVDALRLLGISVAVAVSTCLAEAISRRGLDNVTVPATAYFVLSSLLPTAAQGV